MNSRLVTGLITGVLLLGCYWLEARWNSGGAFPEECAKGPEARGWLQQNDNESALASNRFGSTANALEFVRQLYKAGAVRVIVPEVNITKVSVETYADALVVTLPAEPDKRARVWRLCSAELAREGANHEDDPNENRVFLWWD
jgi:hypothetical protein